MTAKEYLNQARGMRLRIEALEERRARYRDLATRCTARYSQGPGGTTCRQSSVEEYVDRLVDLERQMARRIAAYTELIRDIEAAIDAVEDQRQRDVLKYRYLNGWGWRRIARSMELSEDRVWHIHGEALKKIPPRQ